MDATAIGIACIVVLVLLIVIGLHVGLALALVGGIGMVLLIGFGSGPHILGTAPFAVASDFDLSPLPLFLLMGAFASSGGLGIMAYDAMSRWVGKLPGGLAVATTFGAAFFGLVSGSSMAAASVFTKVALPEMLKRKYDKKLAIGSIAAAGTFSTMIPPSGLLIIYGIFTEQSIGKLFMAGILPGVISALAYAGLIIVRASRNPTLAPTISENFDWRDKWISLLYFWPIFLLSGMVLGGIFLGWFTPNEAGAIGAFGALIIAMAKNGIRGAKVPDALIGCMQITGMIFLIIIGAIIFGRFLSVTQIPVKLAVLLSGPSISRPIVLAGFLVMYLFLGTLLDAVAIFCITLPVVFPVIEHLGFDPVWFAIILIKVSEIGMVTPPVGMNVYVACSTAAGQVTLEETFRGIAPFLICDFFVLILLCIFPQISLLIPSVMFQK